MACIQGVVPLAVLSKLAQEAVTVNTGSNPSEIASPTPAPYTGFDGQYIGGTWRPGSLRTKSIDIDLYSGEVVAETIECNQADLDEAYRAAAKAQLAWSVAAPAERADMIGQRVATNSQPSLRIPPGRGRDENSPRLAGLSLNRPVGR
jgi:hypothetical protein